MYDDQLYTQYTSLVQSLKWTFLEQGKGAKLANRERSGHFRQIIDKTNDVEDK